MCRQAFYPIRQPSSLEFIQARNLESIYIQEKYIRRVGFTIYNYSHKDIVFIHLLSQHFTNVNILPSSVVSAEADGLLCDFKKIALFLVLVLNGYIFYIFLYFQSIFLP